VLAVNVLYVHNLLSFFWQWPMFVAVLRNLT
jgi:hypothetical protein